MAGDLLINKSNKTIPVYKTYWWEDPGSQIGTIYKNEAFVFRNSSGVVTTGYLPLCDENGNSFDIPVSAFTDCTEYPYSTVQLGGKTYKTFKFRRKEEVYTSSGNLWGAVASGMEVACLTAEVGSTHPDWKCIYYVKSSKTGLWEPIGNEGKSPGFVDIGLNQGSMPSTISMYGTW